MNSLDVQASSSLAITRGQSARMAAGLAGVVRKADEIVVIELEQARRDLALGEDLLCHRVVLAAA